MRCLSRSILFVSVSLLFSCGPVDDGNDAGTDAGSDAGSDAGLDAGTDAGTDAGVDPECEPGLTRNCYDLPTGDPRYGGCDYGQETCTPSGTWSGTCEGAVGPSAETCNGEDDDCDGEEDDGLGTISCGESLCTRTVDACVGGAENTCTPGEPQAEVCDGLDNDCDGDPDDGNPGGGGSCTTGAHGQCAAGLNRCVDGALVCEQVTAPSNDICDGRDNDCDGLVDENNPGGGGICSTGRPGVCGPGTSVCSDGELVCVEDTSAGPEVCDGRDNDCDAVIDELNPGGGLVCSTGLAGQCAAGTTQCINADIRCVQNTQPSAEVCNGADENCNGVNDDGDPGGGGSCVGTGACPGTQHCVDGAVRCVCNP